MSYRRTDAIEETSEKYTGVVMVPQTTANIISNKLMVQYAVLPTGLVPIESAGEIETRNIRGLNEQLPETPHKKIYVERLCWPEVVQ